MKHKKLMIGIAIAWLVLVAVALLYFALNPSITGFVSMEKKYNYTKNVDLEYSAGSEYLFSPYSGKLNSLTLSGSYRKAGTAKVYLEHGAKRYLVFDSAVSNASVMPITGFAVSSGLGEEQPNETELNQSVEQDIPIIGNISQNETTQDFTFPEANLTEEPVLEPVNKTIYAVLEYNPGSGYDVDDNGIEALSGVIDFTVKPTLFSWQKDDSMLCTLWSVKSADSGELTTICYGNSECCSENSLSSSSGMWDDIFYLYYGIYGATNSNTLSAEVIYSNMTETASSKSIGLPAQFIDNETVRFEDACIETCLLPGLESDSYKIIVEVSDSQVNIDDISYSISKSISVNTAPILGKNITDLNITQGSSYTINLSGYFSDKENDALNYGYYSTGNITAEFIGDSAKIIPGTGFSGTRFMYFSVNDSEYSEMSNVFAVRVAESPSITPAISSRKKDFKSLEDAKFSFEYKDKSQLVKEGKWKDWYEVFEEKPDIALAELELLNAAVEKRQPQKNRWSSATESIEASVYDIKGNLMPFEPVIQELREGRLSVALPGKRSFRPGLYTLRIKLIQGNVSIVEEQNFTWGVLAINTHKPVYLPDEEAFIGIAVLDDEGKMVCDADVTLDIISPLNEKASLSTRNKKIHVSPECEYYGITSMPDYYAYFNVSVAGSYMLNLTAVTLNGVRNVQDNFTVRDSVDFDITRKGPTRIYPLVPYVMNITLAATKGGNSRIVEKVPSSFSILGGNYESVSDIGDYKEIVFDGKLDVGNAYNLYYEFDAPDTSPEFYILGKLDIGSYSEERYWQVASDAVTRTEFDPAGFNYTYYVAAGTYAVALLGERDHLILKDCASETCTNLNSLATGVYNLSNTVVDVEWNVTLNYSFDTDISGSSIINMTVLFSGCWHGDGAANSCSGTNAPEFADTAPGGNLSVLIYHNGVYEELQCVNNSNRPYLPLGSDSNPPSWGNAYSYHDFAFQKVSGFSDDYLNDGKFSIMFRNFGTAGDSSTNDDTTMVMDYVQVSLTYYRAPEIEFITPLNNSFDSDGNITFVFNATSDSDLNISNCSLIINNMLNQTNSSIDMFRLNNFSLYGIPDGAMLNWSINCTDNRSVISSSGKYNIVTSGQLPSVSDVSASPQTALNGTSVNITAVVVDSSISSVKAMVYYPNGTFYMNVSMSDPDADNTYNCSFVSQFHPSGEYGITIWANDSQNNINSSGTTWFAAYVQLSRFNLTLINGSFDDWEYASNATDPETDTSGVGGGTGFSSYNFSGISSPSSTSNATFGYSPLKFNPNMSYMQPYEKEFSSANYTEISSLGNGYATYRGNNAAIHDFAQHKFTFMISEDPASVTALNISMNGTGGKWEANYVDNWPVFIYNFSAGNWSLLWRNDSNFDNTRYEFKYLSKAITEDCDDFINNSLVYVISHAVPIDAALSEVSDILTDFVKLDVFSDVSGNGGPFDIKAVSLANNNTHLFAFMEINNTLDFSEPSNYYRLFISVNDTTGNATTPESTTNISFNYDFRIQVNGSSCYVFNSTDYVNNISGCLFGNDTNLLEVGVPLSILGAAPGESVKVLFETGSPTESYDMAPDYRSYLEYVVSAGPQANPPEASLVNLTPLAAYTNDTLTCLINVTDSDTSVLTLSISWYRNDVNIFNSTGIDYPQGTLFYANLTANYTFHNDEIYCNISIDDSQNAIQNTSNAVVILNYTTSLSAQNSTSSPAANENVVFYANYSSTLMPVSGIGMKDYEIGQVVWNTTYLGAATYTTRFADLDNDGRKNELIIPYDTGWNDDGLYGFLSNGTQLFKSASQYDPNDPSEAIVFDSDNNGYMDNILVSFGVDFILFNRSGEIIWKNLTGGVAEGGGVVSYGDLDADGKKDDFAIAYQNSSNDKVLIAFNSTEGNNWSEMWRYGRINNEGYNNYISQLGIADMDHDGKGDVIAIDQNGGHIFVVNGSNGALIFNTTDLGVAYSFGIADIDHDSFQDDIIVGRNGDLRIFKFNGSYNIEYSESDAIGSTVSLQGNVFEIASLDLDNDLFKDDYVAAEIGPWDGSEAHVWGFNNDSIVLWNFTLPSNGAGNNVPNSLLAQDINDDGEEEIVVTYLDYSTTYVLNKSGALLWQASVPQNDALSYGTNPPMDCSDVNNDYVNDLAIASNMGYLYLLQDVKCSIYFNDSMYNMTWNESLRKWQSNKTFSSAGTYDYNVTCEKGGYEPQLLTSNIVVSMPDSLKPRINASLDDPAPPKYTRVNMTANVTDETALSFCIFVDNQTLPDGARNYFNKSVAGASDQCSQNYTIRLSPGNVINFTVIVNDTSGNLNQSEQLFTVSANVYNCTTLDAANTVYTMTKNASSSATCMYIAANNVTLDCNGMYINYSQSAAGYGVDITGYNYNTIKNCQIWQADIESEPEACIGVYMAGANNNSVYRSTIVTRSWNSGSFYLNGECSDNAFFNNTVTSRQALAFYLRADSHQNSIYNNNITCEGGTDGCLWFNTAERNLVYDNLLNISGNANRGILLYQASYENQIYHNRIITNDIKSYGIEFQKENWLNQVYGNNITTRSSSGSYAIYLSKGINSNIIFRNTISSLSCGIALNGTNDDDPVAQPLIYNITLINNTIMPCSSGCSPNYFDILLTGNVTDIFLINNSFNKSRIGFIANSPGMPIEKKNLTVQWYLNLNVTNSTNNNPMQAAWVVVNNSFAEIVYNGSTDATGGIQTLAVTEFTMNGSVPFNVDTDTCIDISTNENITCFTPYNLSVNMTGYTPAVKSIDLNTSRFLNISMTLASTDTCSCPASGNWQAAFEDNCVITAACDMQGNNVSITGDGTWVIESKITNFRKLITHGPGMIICRNASGCFA